MPSLIVTTAILIVLGVVVILIWTGVLGNFLSPVHATNAETVIRNCCGDRSKWDCNSGTTATVMCRTPTGEVKSLQTLASEANINDDQLCRLCFCTNC